MSRSDIITSLDRIRVSGYECLSVRGKALYRAKCKELMDDGELRKGFLQSLILWAENYDNIWRLKEELNKEGWTFKTHNKFGDEVVSANPKVKMMKDCEKRADGILLEFGASLKQSRKLGKTASTKSPLEQWMEENDEG